MPRPPLRTARELLVTLSVAAALSVVLCWSDLSEVVARMEHSPHREQLLSLLRGELQRDLRVAPAPSSLEARAAPAPAPAPARPVMPSWWRPISAESPLQVWVIGDSLVNMTAPELKRQLESTGLAEVRAESRPNTGLVRDDFYSWPARIAHYLGENDVDVIVLMTGANDSQNMMVDRQRIDLRTDAWLTEYDRRIAELMDVSSAAGVRLYWAGLPVMRKSRHQLTAQLVNPLLQAAAAERPHVQYISTWELFAGDQGEYRYWGYTAGGRKVSMRDTDGVHFTMAGAIRLADHLRAALEVDWPLSADAAAEGVADSGQP